MRGFIYEDNPEDYVFGSERSLGEKFKGRIILQEDSNWVHYLPTTEPQSNTITETSGCASFNTLNCIEILRKRMSQIDENLSDRFVAKGSGTDPRFGNVPTKVADFIRKQWSVYEREWPFTKEMSVEEFYKEIPSNLFKIASARGVEYSFGYERIQYKDIKEALKYSPLGISVPAWTEQNGVYIRPKGMVDNHWTVCIGMFDNGDLQIFDSYYPYIKRLSKDVVPQMILGYYLNRNVKDETFWQKFLEIIKKIFDQPQQSILLTRENLLEKAKYYVGKDASPADIANDEFGCAESVSMIIRELDPTFPIITYTPYLKRELDKNPHFKQTQIYKPGCIIISPTQDFVGHVGILGENDKIYSNNSLKKVWDDYFDLAKWIARYRVKGGLSIYFYEPVIHS